MQETTRPALRVRFGVFEVDLTSGELRKRGSRIPLQEQPFRILVRLLERPGEVVTRDELRQELWPADTFVDFDHGLNAAIKRLRDALGDAADTPRFIETLPRRGYRFVGSVQRDAGLGDPPAAPGTIGGSRSMKRTAWFIGIGIGIAAALGATATLLWFGPRERAPSPTAKFNLALPPNVGLPVHGMVAITRAGDRVFFLGIERDNVRRLYVRSLTSEDAVPLQGSDGALLPIVLSPDEQWIGYFTNDLLMKVPSTGGTAVPVADVRDIGGGREVRGASWLSDGTILIGGALRGLSRVRAAGGAPEPVTTVDSKAGHVGHRWPSALPGGRLVLFSTFGRAPREDDREICLLDLASGQWRVLLRQGQYPQYAASGHILYAREGSIFAVPFDAARGLITGDSAAVLHDVQMYTRGTGEAYFAVSETGSLVYVPGTPNIQARRLVWVDRRGVAEPVSAERRPYGHARLSPDGRRVAVGVTSGTRGDLWTLDLETRAWTQVTSDGTSHHPIWSADGRRLAFAGLAGGAPNIYWIPADGSGSAVRLTESTNWQWPLAFTRDGRLFFSDQAAQGGLDIGLLHPPDRDASRPFLASPRDESAAVPSPDNRWVAYVSNETDRPAVHVRSASEPLRNWLVPEGYGMEPAWSRDGRELFFRQGTRMLSVDVGQTGGELRLGAARLLFDAAFVTAQNMIVRQYDVGSDGRFLMLEESPEARTQLQMVYVPNWLDDLRRRLGASRGR